MHKTCRHCLVSKKIDDFPRVKKGKELRISLCKKCRRIQIVEWRQSKYGVRKCLECHIVPLFTSSPRCKECRVIWRRRKRKAYLLSNPDIRKNGIACTTRWARKNRAHIKNLRRKFYLQNARLKRYGLSKDEFLALSQQQKCGICGDAEKLHIDHDHNTKKVRGLLCPRCNTGIGLLKESPKLLLLAASYLVQHGKKLC